MKGVERYVEGVVWNVVGGIVCSEDGGIVCIVGGEGVEDCNARDVLKSPTEELVVEIFLGVANVDNNKISSGTELDCFGKTTIGFVEENGDSVENISDIGLGWKPSLITFAEYQDSGKESDISARHSCNTGIRKNIYEKTDEQEVQFVVRAVNVVASTVVNKLWYYFQYA